MLALGMRNFRRLRDIDPKEIRPITVLVGRNSSGKSTFLRTFPLIRQSLSARSSAPLSWYGDLVDLGSYKVVLAQDRPSNDSIEFRFRLDELRKPRRTPGFSRYDIDIDMLQVGSERTLTGNVALSVEISTIAQKTVIRSIRVVDEGSQNVLQISTSGSQQRVTAVSLNEGNYTSIFDKVRLSLRPGTIFPRLHAIPSAKANARLPFAGPTGAIAEVAAELITPLLKKGTEPYAVQQIAALLMVPSSIEPDVLARLYSRLRVPGFRHLVARLHKQSASAVLAKLEDLRRLHRMVAITGALSERLTDIFQGVIYIGPLRAQSERYYRTQELGVADIDADGRNFPMFLRSLKPQQLESFSDWVNDLLGFELKVSEAGGHISLDLVHDSSTVNVVDTGFGVSQVLPVLGQIWWATSADRDSRRLAGGSRDVVLAIEQPELHLHPAHQALIADALVAGLTRTETASRTQIGREFCFLVETHSEAIVNRLGQLIRDGALDPMKIAILVFEPSNVGAASTASVAHYDAQGLLVNWPFGFFLAT